MSATATLPLPLELTKPVELSSSLEDALREAFAVASVKYNDQTQVRENAEGNPHFYDHEGSQSNSESESAGLFITDVLDDINLDDNNIDL